MKLINQNNKIMEYYNNQCNISDLTDKMNAQLDEPIVVPILDEDESPEPKKSTVN